MPERVIDALGKLSRDHTLWQPHNFTKPMSAGLSELMASRNSRALLDEASDARLFASNMIGRADSNPYMYNFLGHVIVHGMRHRDVGAEEKLSDFVADSDNLNNPLHDYKYWRDSIIASFEELHIAGKWPSLCLRDTSTCVESRFKAALWGLAAHRLARDGGFAELGDEPESLRIIDFGSSVNFALAALLNKHNAVVLKQGSEIKTVNFQAEYGIGIDQLMDEPLGGGNIHLSWTRSCSIPLRDLGRREAVNEYDSRANAVVALRNRGVIKQVRMVPGYDPYSDLKPELIRIISAEQSMQAPNAAIHSTYLHQLNENGRDSMLAIADDTIIEGGVQVVADFANVVDGNIQFASNRWHGSTAVHQPYGAFIKINGEWYETARSQTSRCNEDKPHLPESSIFREHGVDGIQVF